MATKSLFTEEPEMKLSVADVFGDYMVLQRGREVPIWGDAPPYALVRVEVAGRSASAKAGGDGKWMGTLPAMEAGGPYEMVVSAAALEPVRLQEVLIGEVWIASGQSNMEWPLSWSDKGAEAIAAANWPRIRHMTIAHRAAPEPSHTAMTLGWKPTTPETAGDLSAIAYYFAVNLQEELDVPIGIIDNSYGGAAMEAYVPLEALKSSPTFAWAVRAFMDWDAFQRNPNGPAEYEAAYKKWKSQTGGDLYHDDPGIQPAERPFADPDFDDSGWKEMELPGAWESKGLEGTDGAVWFRYHVNIPTDWPATSLTLTLGPLDDYDVTFFNGTEVGGMGIGSINSWATPRVYPVPESLVKPGDNVIAVRVFDHYLGGGFTGGASQMRLFPSGQEGPALSLAGAWKYNVSIPLMQQPSPAGGMNENQVPSGLFNGMVAPVIPYAMRGVIWYQGETNAGRWQEYLELSELMISSWRSRWGQGEFPFLVATISSWEAGGDAWPFLREAQIQTVERDPNAALIVTTDVGDRNDIHPKDKRTVGGRFALAARKLVYGEDIIASGPRFATMEAKDGKLHITFETDGARLAVVDTQNLRGFSIAGGDGTYHPAEARIIGDGKVLAWSDDVEEPVSVRYGWEGFTDANLINHLGLPAVPFRAGENE